MLINCKNNSIKISLSTAITVIATITITTWIEIIKIPVELVSKLNKNSKIVTTYNKIKMIEVR
jgi:hypothetical protein